LNASQGTELLSLSNASAKQFIADSGEERLQEIADAAEPYFNIEAECQLSKPR
jgi:hypothetical protein